MLLRSSFFFVFWFLWIGGANILPQLYFIQVAPETKETWVALLLVLGSMASLAGFIGAGRVAYSKQSNNFKSLLLLVLIAASFSLLFFSVPIWAYLLAYLIFRLVSCYAYQRFDYQMVHSLSHDKAQKYSNFSVLFMLVGVTVGPVFFAYFYNPYIAVPVVMGLVVFTLISVWGLSLKRPQQEDVVSGVLNAQDKWFLLYSGAYLAVIFLTSSILVYFLRDYYLLESPAKWAGVVMVLTSGGAFVASLIYGMKRQQVAGDVSVTWVNGLVIGLQLFAIGLLYAKPSTELWFLCGCGFLMGVSYGVFMVIGRAYASQRDKQSHNGLLSRFNRLPYVSTILAFAVAGGLNMVGALLPWNYYTSIFGFVVLLLAIASLAGYRLNTMPNEDFEQNTEKNVS